MEPHSRQVLGGSLPLLSPAFKRSHFRLCIRSDARDPSSERWNCWREIQGSFTCRKSTTWDRRLHLPSEGRRAEYFSAGLNPRTWVPEASTLPLDHRSRSHVICYKKNSPNKTVNRRLVQVYNSTGQHHAETENCTEKRSVQAHTHTHTHTHRENNHARGKYTNNCPVCTPTTRLLMYSQYITH